MLIKETKHKDNEDEGQTMKIKKVLLVTDTQKNNDTQDTQCTVT